MGKSILITLVAVVAFQVIWMTYEKLTYKKATPDSHDRVMIKPGPMSWVVCLLCTVFCISFGIMTIGSIATNDDVLFWLVLGPPLTAIMGLGAYVSFGHDCGLQVLMSNIEV